MNTAATTTTSTHVRRIGALVAAAAAGALAMAGPAAAAPQGPGDHTIVEPGGLDGITLAEPDDDPSDDLPSFVPILDLDATSECDPEAGVAYTASVLKGPGPDRPNEPNVEWTDVDDGSVGVVPGLDGFLPFEDGTYELVATVYYPPHGEDGPLGLVSDPVAVTVACGAAPADPADPANPEDPEDPTGPEGPQEPAEPSDPEDPATEVDDEIVEAVPTFTG